MSKKEIIEKEGVRYEVIRVLKEEKKVIVEGVGDVSEYECWYDEKYCLRAVKNNGHALRYVKEQTPELCLRAVKNYGDALRYVKEQTPELCLEAVKEDGDALSYVNKKVFKQNKLK